MPREEDMITLMTTGLVLWLFLGVAVVLAWAEWLHAFRNESDDPVSMLLLFAPGAPREEYFEKVAEMAKRGGEEFADFLVRYDSYFVDHS